MIRRPDEGLGKQLIAGSAGQIFVEMGEVYVQLWTSYGRYDNDDMIRIIICLQNKLYDTHKMSKLLDFSL